MRQHREDAPPAILIKQEQEELGPASSLRSTGLLQPRRPQELENTGTGLTPQSRIPPLPELLGKLTCPIHRRAECKSWGGGPALPLPLTSMVALQLPADPPPFLMPGP